MDPRELWNDLSGDFRRDLIFGLFSLLVFVTALAGHNLMTPEEPLRVGYVELETECMGIETGACIGLELRNHETYNYDDYSRAEPGTENYYRRVEAELMIQAYNICGSDTEGMEWLQEASYLNRTGEEWSQMEEVRVLPCSQVTYRNMTQG